VDNSKPAKKCKGDVTRTFWIKFLVTMQVVIDSTVLKPPYNGTSSWNIKLLRMNHL